MEDLFRFILARPAQQADVKQTIEVTPSAETHMRLKEARLSRSFRDALKRLAQTQRDSTRVRSVDDLRHGKELKQLASTLESNPTISLTDLDTLIAKVLLWSPKELMRDRALVPDRESLSDVLVTNAILGSDGPITSYEATRLLRTIAVIERAATDDPSLGAVSGVGNAMNRALLLPADIFPLTGARAPSAPSAPPPDQSHRAADERRRSELINRRTELLTAYTVITRLEPEQLVTVDASRVNDRRVDAPSDHTLEAALPPVAEADLSNRLRAAAPLPRVEIRPTVVTTGEVTAPLLLKATVAAAFDPVTRSVLADRNLDLTRVRLPAAADRLSAELQQVEQELIPLTVAAESRMVRLGGGFAPAVSSGSSAMTAATTVPTSHGSVAPAGIGDLLVVKQSLKRYEARELAHIENVLKGESKERVHKRSRTTEETFTVETETRREEERDTQTTERFELKRESSEILKQDMSLKAGLAVSGKYGPVVEFKASADFAYNTSKEEATKIATTFSKDVTTRASSKVFERHREERILKTIEVFEETNTHGIDNKAGAAHVIGQYQWIEKLYEAQIFNYGKRLLFDIMLPEPAAYLIHALSHRPKAGADLVKPDPFMLSPLDVNEWNYSYYVRKYEAAGVVPPPQPYLTLAKAVDGKGTINDGVTKVVEIPLPDGYEAFTYEWWWQANHWDNGDVRALIVPNPVNKVGMVTFAVKTWKVEAFIASIGITCRRTQRLLDDWKLKTHAAILQGYQKLLRDYQERLAAAEVEAAVQIQGRNPLENEKLIRTELKKGAISVFTDQQYDLFDAIGFSSQGFPQPDLIEGAAEGKYIRFFEQAFEWEQMMFFYYPYFWGRKDRWLTTSLLQDVDPLFADFIKAGAARLVVSVRPGFEQAVAHFLDTGETWDGGDLPPITSPLYVSIIEEIRERDKAPSTEIAQGDPWDVRLPTTLVKLRDQASLPAWQKNAQGEWVPI